jgi:hypothetical protein
MMRRATKSNLLMKALSSRLGTMAITSSARLMVAGSVLGEGNAQGGYVQRQD